MLNKNFKRSLQAAKGWVKDNALMRVIALTLMCIVTVGSVVTVMAAQRNVYITVNGQEMTASTDKECATAEEAAALLEARGVTLGENDLMDFRTGEDQAIYITVRSGYNVTVTADGNTFTGVAHHGDSVRSVLDKLKVTLDGDDVVAPPVTESISGETPIAVTRYHMVSVTADGETKAALAKEGSVQSALASAGITLGSEDIVSQDLTAPVTEGMEITVNRVTYEEVTETVAVPYGKVTEKDKTLEKGKTKVKAAGVNGEKIVVTKQKLVDGQVAETQELSSTVTKEPVDEVVQVGTKAANKFATVVADGTLLDENGNAVNYSKVITGKCSAYTGGGWTSTGKAAAKGLVAVNPNIIPYGTKLYICSPDGKIVYGYAIAADTGGACMSNIIVADLYYDTYNECKQIGVRNMSVYVLS